VHTTTGFRYCHPISYRRSDDSSMVVACQPAAVEAGGSRVPGIHDRRD